MIKKSWATKWNCDFNTETPAACICPFPAGEIRGDKMSDAEAPDQSVIEITAIRWFTRRLRLSSFAFLKKAALESKLQPKKSVERDSSCRIYPSIRKCT